MILKIQCPAKVNLFLEVTGKRRDGYHLLQTIFAKINLFDSLEVESLETGPIQLTVEQGNGAVVPAGEDNLVFRAAAAFRKEFNVKAGVRLLLKKSIPVGAGLGGGSSDAAGTLVGMHRAFGPGATKKTKAQAMASMKKIAASLGADVPFFLQDEPFCLGQGIGERLKGLSVAKAPPYMILVYPGSAIPTAGVYKALNRPSRSDVLTRLSQLSTLSKKLGGGRPISEWDGLLFNRLEEAVLPAHPEVGQAKRILTQLGARGTLMSGSGSSVFGFVGSHEEGERVRTRLSNYPWQVFLTCCMG
ncbi:MAG: 4-(cytidine 5'-diphospho)-2-C-methyl-D-erythritol kinase [Elusimicrobia bacterium]|nr:4-(cytidine 5'-diphospho)-2-C-methyl-D-erythritol kinase [Elusimicrobiota bacterium]